MRRAWGIGVGIVGIVIGAGCLSDGRRVGDTSVGDTGDTSVADTGDTSVGDTGTSDTIRWDADVPRETVACGPCDDGDPCTYDRCNPETGECEHLGYPSGEPGSGDAIPAPVDACQGDRDCTAGGECAVGSCVRVPGSCGFPDRSVCTYETIPGCTATCQTGCDDGNACTDDVCLADGSCWHAPLDGCLPACTKAGLVSLDEAASSAWMERVKTVGALGPASVGGACNDGPTCDCVMGPSLHGGGQEIELLPGDADGVALPPDPNDAAAWQCTTKGCTTLAVQCQPLVEGAVFRVWGRPLTGPVPFGGGAVPVMPKVVAIEVEGYCLDTDGPSLDGTYEGRLEVLPGVFVRFGVTMTLVDQGVIVEVGQAECVGGQCPEWATKGIAQGLVIEEGDGWIGFDFVAPSFVGGQNAHARLFSNRGRFVGRWEPTFGLPNGIVVASGGSIELVRLGTGELPDASLPWAP